MSDAHVQLLIAVASLAAGAYVWAWVLYVSLRRELRNHLDTRLKRLESEVFGRGGPE